MQQVYGFYSSVVTSYNNQTSASSSIS